MDIYKNKSLKNKLTFKHHQEQLIADKARTTNSFPSKTIQEFRILILHTIHYP